MMSVNFDWKSSVREIIIFARRFSCLKSILVTKNNSTRDYKKLDFSPEPDEDQKTTAVREAN